MAPDKSTVGAKVSPNLEERIEEYQKEEKFSNKSDAVRDLIETGLSAQDNTGTTVPVEYAMILFGAILFSAAHLTLSPALWGHAGLVLILLALLSIQPIVQNAIQRVQQLAKRSVTSIQKR